MQRFGIRRETAAGSRGAGVIHVSVVKLVVKYLFLTLSFPDSGIS